MVDLSFGFLVTATLAGVVTILSPCVLPLLPLMITSSDRYGSRRTLWLRPLLIIVSLSLSIFTFTLLLKVSTALIGFPAEVWQIIAGAILIVFGLLTLWPEVWEKLNRRNRIKQQSQRLLAKGLQRQNYWGGILIGVSLGPIFSSCSPAYFAIVATVFPASYGAGLIYLSAYVAGLALILALITVFGQLLVKRLAILSNPKGWFKRLIGLAFVVIGLLIVTGLNKQIETWMVDRGWFYNPAVIQEVVPDNNPASPQPAAGVIINRY